MGCEVDFGKVIHGHRRATLKVKLASLVSMVRKKIKNLANRTFGGQFAPPVGAEPSLRGM